MKNHPIHFLSKQIAFLFVSLCLASQLYAQDFSLIPYRKGNNWGYCDAKKKIKIEPRFERTYWFAENGLARVKTQNKYGYINKKGKLVIEAKFDDASDFNYSGALVKMNGKSYCLDKEGGLTETTKESPFGCSGLISADDFGGEGLCSNCCVPYKAYGKYGIVCTEYTYENDDFKVTGKDSIPSIYDTIFSSIGYSVDFMPLVAKKNGKYGIVDGKNKTVYDFVYDSIAVITYDAFMLLDRDGWHFKNANDELYSGIEKWDSYIFSSGYYFPVSVNGKWGVLNESGKEVVPFNFEDIKLPSRMIINREFTIRQNGKWGYLSDQGNIAPVYEDLQPFDGYDYTQVVKGGKEGYIGLDGTEYFEE